MLQPKAILISSTLLVSKQSAPEGLQLLDKLGGGRGASEQSHVSFPAKRHCCLAAMLGSTSAEEQLICASAWFKACAH